MTFGRLNLGFGWRRGGATGTTPTPAINSVTISPDGGEEGTLFTAVVSVSGYPTPSLAYEWRDGGVAISGATSATYLRSTPIAVMTLFVTATNSEGSDSLESHAVVVTGPSGQIYGLITSLGDRLITSGNDRLYGEYA